MRLLVIILAGLIAASVALWGSAARSQSTNLEQVKWASTVCPTGGLRLCWDHVTKRNLLRQPQVRREATAGAPLC